MQSTCSALAQANAIAFCLPMHTATRIAIEVRLRTLNPSGHLRAYGIYAPVNHAYLEKLGVETIVGGEYEPHTMNSPCAHRVGGNIFVWV